MRPLLLGEAEKRELQSLVAYAKAHVFTVDSILDIKNKEKDAQIPGDSGEFVRLIPVGYRVVFTIEEHPAGRARHLSISVDREGRLPSVESCELIMQEVGFRGRIPVCRVFLENIGPNRDCVNILEIMAKHEL